MLSLEERNEIRTAVFSDLADIEDQITNHAGSYDYLCLVGGGPVFTHKPVGRVIRRLYRPKRPRSNL